MILNISFITLYFLIFHIMHYDILMFYIYINDYFLILNHLHSAKKILDFFFFFDKTGKFIKIPRELVNTDKFKSISLIY